jgi:hypothetical protein
MSKDKIKKKNQFKKWSNIKDQTKTGLIIFEICDMGYEIKITPKKKHKKSRQNS